MLYLNFAMQHLSGWVLLTFILLPFVKGVALYRWCGWFAAWQILTPLQSWYIDIPCILIGFLITEYLYLKFRFNLKGGHTNENARRKGEEH